MPPPLQLELVDSGGSYTFSVDGGLEIRQIRDHNEQAEPVTLRRITEVWEVTNARVVGTSTEDLWDNIGTLFSELEDRDTTPFTTARVVRDPTGSAVVERTLGGGSQEGFRVDVVRLHEDPDAPAGTWRSVVAVDLTLSAFQQFNAAAGAGNDGLATWEQTITSRAGPDGLHVLEWVTTLSVAEGSATTALAQAQTHAVIPIATYGNTYVYDTNADDGFDYEFLDPNTSLTTDRTPTRIRVTSRIKQKGVSVGVAATGNSVGDVLEQSTTVVENAEGFRTTITRCTALGPGALTYARNQRPTGAIRESREFHDEANRRVTIEWLQDSNQTTVNRREITAVLSGGGRAEEFVAISGDFPPVLVIGPRQTYRLDVTIRVVTVGDTPANSDMLLPQQLPDPWRLVRGAGATQESFVPKRIATGNQEGSDRWERTAKVVYVSPEAPSEDTARVLFDDGSGIASYLSDDAVPQIYLGGLGG